MVALRGRAVVAVVTVAVMVSGCSTTEGTPAPASTTESRSAAPPQSSKAAPVAPPSSSFDVSRILALQDAMPPGFIATPASGVITLNPALAANVGGVVSYGKPFIVEPAGCRALLQQVTASVGALSQRVRGDGTSKRAISIGAVVPVDVPDPIPASGCQRMTYDVDQAEYSMRGTVERLPAPAIDGAVTIALRNVVEGYPDAEYYYSAIVGGQLYVDVNARLAEDFPTESVLGDLLVMAVAAVRGQ